MADEDVTRTLTDGVAVPADDLEAGDRIGRYVLTEPIGRGGAGVVWAARDPLVGDEVAVKLVRWLAPRAMRQYRRELATLFVLQIPGVVRIRDEGDHHSFVYVVTERIHGRPFASLAEADRDPRNWLGSVLALLDTLARVHLAGVTHADLKPGNILVDAEGRPTILDFGLARGRTTVVAEGLVEGTPRYMAPEQRRGEPVTPRTDLYAVGGMLLEMITGQALSVPPDLAPLDAIDLPGGLAGAIRQMLAQDPAGRPASAMEVLQALDVDPMPAPERWIGSGPWTELELRDLFDDVRGQAGLADSLQHLARDGAQRLFEAAGGDPDRTVEVLRRWVRAGEVRWTPDGRIEVERAELERLGAQRPDAPERRLVDRLANGEDERAVTTEALQLATELERASRPGRALAVLDAAALWTRGQPEEAEVLQRRVRLRIGRWSTRAIDEASGHVAASGVAGPLRVALLDLLRGARAALVGEATEARTWLEEPSALVLPALRESCVAILAFAAMRLPVVEHQAILDRLAAQRFEDASLLPKIRGQFAYRMGDYEAAAKQSEAAADQSRTALASAAQWAQAAASRVEIGDWDRALTLAALAKQHGRQARVPACEFQARWLERVAGYRRGTDDLTPSQAFVRAATTVGTRFAGQAGYIEAAIAWRAGDRALAEALAGPAAEALHQTQQIRLALLVEALQLDLGSASRSAGAIGAEAYGIDDEFEVQILALVVKYGGEPVHYDRAIELLDRLPTRNPAERLDLLSLEECRESLGSARQGPSQPSGNTEMP